MVSSSATGVHFLPYLPLLTLPLNPTILLLLASFPLTHSLRDMQAGERLTFSYAGPAELEISDVRKRRELLLQKFKFLCGCERCTAEAAAQESPAQDASAQSPVHVQ